MQEALQSNGTLTRSTDGWVALAACLGAACALLLLLLLRRWGLLGGKFKFDDGTLPEGAHPRAQACRGRARDRRRPPTPRAEGSSPDARGPSPRRAPTIRSPRSRVVWFPRRASSASLKTPRRATRRGSRGSEAMRT